MNNQNYSNEWLGSVRNNSNISNTNIGISNKEYIDIYEPDYQIIDNLGFNKAVGLGLPYYDLLEIINIAFALVILGSSLVSIFMMIKGGIKLITSDNDAEAHKGAMITIRNSIVGMFIVLLSFTLVYYLGKILGYNITSYISWEKLSELLKNISISVRSSSLR